MKYRVTCWSPPQQFKLTEGDIIVAGGYAFKDKIRATVITNKTQKIGTCNCSEPPGFTAQAYQQVTGTVSNIVYDTEFTEFDLTEV